MSSSEESSSNSPEKPLPPQVECFFGGAEDCFSNYFLAAISKQGDPDSVKDRTSTLQVIAGVSDSVKALPWIGATVAGIASVAITGYERLWGRWNRNRVVNWIGDASPEGLARKAAKRLVKCYKVQAMLLSEGGARDLGRFAAESVMANIVSEELRPQVAQPKIGCANHGFWQNDDTVEECPNPNCRRKLYKNAWRTYYRPHHCRRCGYVMCDGCAPAPADNPQARRCSRCRRAERETGPPFDDHPLLRVCLRAVRGSVALSPVLVDRIAGLTNMALDLYRRANRKSQELCVEEGGNPSAHQWDARWILTRCGVQFPDGRRCLWDRHLAAAALLGCCSLEQRDLGAKMGDLVLFPQKREKKEELSEGGVEWKGDAKPPLVQSRELEPDIPEDEGLDWRLVNEEDWRDDIVAYPKITPVSPAERERWLADEETVVDPFMPRVVKEEKPKKEDPIANPLVVKEDPIVKLKKKEPIVKPAKLLTPKEHPKAKRKPGGVMILGKQLQGIGLPLGMPPPQKMKVGKASVTRTLEHPTKDRPAPPKKHPPTRRRRKK